MNSQQGMRRILLLMTAVLMTLAAFGAAGAETTLERARREGTIRLGLSNPIPIAYRTSDGTITGHDIEVARIILKTLGVDHVDGVVTEFSSLIPGLKADRIDIIANGLYVTPKRCEEIAFSEPVFRFGEALLTPRGNPKKIATMLDFTRDKRLRLAVMAGSAEFSYARDAGIDDSQLLIVRDNASLVAAVRSGRADGGALPAPQVVDIVKKSADVEMPPPYYEVAGKSVAGYGAYGFRKEDKDLVEAFNDRLKSFIGSPAHMALLTRFGWNKDYLPTKTTADLCAGK